MGKSGRKVEWTNTIDAGQLAAIEQAADSEAREAALSIYRRFGLATAGVSQRTFGYWVAQRRKRNRDVRLETPLAAHDVPSWDEIDRRARQAMLRALDAGDSKIYELALLSRSRREQDRLELDRKVETRAEEKHEQWREEARKKKAEADSKLDRIASEEGVTDRVRDAIKDLYGLST